jgi:hypothetical protein
LAGDADGDNDDEVDDDDDDDDDDDEGTENRFIFDVHDLIITTNLKATMSSRTKAPRPKMKTVSRSKRRTATATATTALPSLKGSWRHSSTLPGTGEPAPARGGT